MMNCEEFELHGLDLDRADADPREAAAAAEHAEGCGRCSAMLEAWREVKCDLQLLREATGLSAAPARVEMRLKQELRTRREARVPHRAAVISAWALAAAAVLIGAVSWEAWQRTQRKEPSARSVAIPSVPERKSENPNTTDLPAQTVASGARSENIPSAEPKKKTSNAHSTVAKEEEAEKFTLLPGSLPGETDEAAVVRVRMQRGALGTLGLPVNEERADEWIMVDLLVGNDGLPQAVRLAR